jgi:hypothetical protein
LPSPIEFKTTTTDLLKDGSGDATTGTCGSQATGNDGSDGYDSHTIIRADRKGSFFDSTQVGTEEGDSLTRPADFEDTGICNQIIGNKIFPISKLRIQQSSSTGGNVALSSGQYGNTNLFGNFKIDSADISGNAYTRGYAAKIGARRYGRQSLWDKLSVFLSSGASLDQLFYARLIRPNGVLNFPAMNSFKFTLAHNQLALCICSPNFEPTINQVVENGDNVTNSDYLDKSLNDRRVFFRFWDDTVDRFKYFDTFLTLKEYSEGITFNINVSQTSATVIDANRWTVGVDVTYSINESQFSETLQRTDVFNRCAFGEARLIAQVLRDVGNINAPVAGTVDGDDVAGLLKLDKPGVYRVTTADPWWASELRTWHIFGPNNRLSTEGKWLHVWIEGFEITTT